MRSTTKKYHVIIPGKVVGILFLSLFLSLFLYGQNEERIDTTAELRYQLDTVTVEDTVAEANDEEYITEDNSEVKNEQEYFLRKEFTGGFDTLQLRNIPDSFLKTMRNDKAFWYANEVFKKRENKRQVPFTAHPVFQSILWLVIIAGFVTFLILYLYNSNVGLFRKSANIAIDEEENEHSDIFAINYNKEIDKAIGLNDYRLAVRLMFLRLLRNLSDKKIIQYKPDNTNLDYLAQLRSTAMYPEFFRLTRNYEYSWYGQFDIDKEKFAVIKKEFENFESKNKSVS